jgi:hypothetical protein
MTDVPREEKTAEVLSVLLTFDRRDLMLLLFV